MFLGGWSIKEGTTFVCVVGYFLSEINIIENYYTCVFFSKNLVEMNEIRKRNDWCVEKEWMGDR